MGDSRKKSGKARTKSDQVVNGARCAEVVLTHHRLNCFVGIKAETGHHVMRAA
jgi:hypothetical protein